MISFIISDFSGRCVCSSSIFASLLAICLASVASMPMTKGQIKAVADPSVSVKEIMDALEDWMKLEGSFDLYALTKRLRTEVIHTIIMES